MLQIKHIKKLHSYKRVFLSNTNYLMNYSAPKDATTKLLEDQEHVLLKLETQL